jgi:hypothetical protein
MFPHVRLCDFDAALQHFALTLHVVYAGLQLLALIKRFNKTLLEFFELP